MTVPPSQGVSSGLEKHKESILDCYYKFNYAEAKTIK